MRMKEQRRAKYIRYRKEQKRKKLLLFCLLVFLLLAGGIIRWRSREQNAGAVQEPQGTGIEQGTDLLQVHFIDVGQGDATLITCKGHAMLIDAGDNSKGTAIQLYLKKQGVEKLDYLIGTHPDADHIGGLDVIITKFDCDIVMMPGIERDTASCRDVKMAMEYRGYKNTLPVPGTEYSLGDAVFTVIAPNREYGEDYNNASVGILLKFGNTGFVFTGDAESEAEEDMLQNGIDLKADVLKAGHHGSSDSTSEAFLDAVQPSCVVVSCGKDNDYGHPHKTVLNRLEERGITLYRTDEQGSIVAFSDGEKVSFQ